MSAQPLNISGKSDKLAKLGDLPLVAQTPESLLDDETTPTALMFIRNNGLTPPPAADPDNWTLTIDGEVDAPLQLTLRDLKSRFATISRHLLIECGGNGRSFFHPPIKGNPWRHGGAGCPQWTGVRLADVLKAARLKPSALFSAHYGADPTVDGETDKPALSRGVPIAKLLDESNMLVWAINGEPLPQEHGFPLRLIIPGWPGSVSAKWLTRIWLRDRRHDGPGMTGISYRVPIRPMPAGTYDDKNLKDLESMPVRSIITSPADGARLPAGTRTVGLRGAAWAGDDEVARVEISIDGGASWQAANLRPPRNRHDWQRWSADITIRDGIHSLDVWARATDTRGNVQPVEALNWNPHGVGGNPIHRIKLTIGG